MTTNTKCSCKIVGEIDSIENSLQAFYYNIINWDIY